MVLNRVSWNLLGPIHIPSGSSTAVISTVKSLFAVSSSFWQLVETANSGTNSIVVKPILNNNTASSNNIHVVIAVGVTASAAYATNHTAASANERVQIGICAESGTFKTFQHIEPFGQNKRWSKYVHCAGTAIISASFILESEESLFLGFKDRSTNSGTLGALVGAIGESFDSGSGDKVTGSTGRLYGLASSGPAIMGTTFWSVNTGMFSQSTTANQSAAGIFATSGGISYNVFDTIQRYEVPSTQNNITANSFKVGVPFFWKKQSNEFRAIGKPRGVYMYEETKGLLQYSSGAQVVAYSVSAQFGTTADTMMFVPASGALAAGVDFGGNK